jgi:polyketide biosynthesis enoyl-CoA hydratase PksH
MNFTASTNGYSLVTYQTLRVHARSGVQNIKLHRPEARNAINHTMVKELSSLLSELEGQEMIKIIVLEGQPDVFCSGIDFHEYIEHAQDEARPDKSVMLSDFYGLLEQLSQSSKIIVSRVEGAVIAGGMGFTAVSDLVVAHENATFALSELLFGLLPAIVLPFLLRRVGAHKARLLALSTRPLTAKEAQGWGLVDACGEDTDKLLRPYLQRWRRVSPVAIARLKAYLTSLSKASGFDLAEELERTRSSVGPTPKALAVKTISDLLSDPEIALGIRRFVEEERLPWSI